MKKSTAIKILKDHNEWRRGSEKKPIGSPKLIGEAIDKVIKLLSKKTKVK